MSSAAARVVLSILLILGAMLAATSLASETRAQSPEAKLSRLSVKPEGSMAGYDRDDYPHWSDAREFGWKLPPGTSEPESCDTREAALSGAFPMEEYRTQTVIRTLVRWLIDAQPLEAS